MTERHATSLKGLVLTGGKSSRMGQPKAEICYHGEPEYLRCCNLLKTVCDEVYVSTSEFWAPNIDEATHVKLLPDPAGRSFGPVSGLSSAFKLDPKAAWFVLACDLPYFDSKALAELCAQRDFSKQATCFIGYLRRPEPLCAIYEPGAADEVADAIDADRRCARSVLEKMEIKRVDPSQTKWVQNVNDRAEFEKVMGRATGKEIQVEVQFVAQLREMAGASVERVTTNRITPQALYDDLRLKYGFLLKPQHMRVAVNEEVVEWDRHLKENDRVMFVPPVAGG